jgi:hypothetical protein
MCEGAERSTRTVAGLYHVITLRTFVNLKNTFKFITKPYLS